MISPVDDSLPPLDSPVLDSAPPVLDDSLPPLEPLPLSSVAIEVVSVTDEVGSVPKLVDSPLPPP
jgi:hypothetical protein